MTLEFRARNQFLNYLNRKERWACLVAHRRAGKTWHVVADIIKKAFENNRKEPPPRYAYIAPTREQAKDIAWGYFHAFLEKVPSVKFNESELKVTFPNEASVRLYSGESYERMRGLYFDGVVVDEMADINPKAWREVIRPTLSDYEGWATFIGTPKGRNAFYGIHKKASSDDEWYSLVLKSSSSGILKESEILALKKDAEEEDFLQEFECDFTIPARGAVYKKELARAKAENRITPFPISNHLPVVSSWDIGKRDLTVVWFSQKEGYYYKLLDCLMFRHESIGDIVAAVLAWASEKKLSFAGHMLPHDAGHEQFGKNHNTSVREMVEQAGLVNVKVVPRIPKLPIGIGYVREIFPSLVFNVDTLDRNYTFDGVELTALTALENYAYPEIGSKSRGVEPIHNIYSHPCDALRTLVEGDKRGLVPKGVLSVEEEEEPEFMRSVVGDFEFF